MSKMYLTSTIPMQVSWAGGTLNLQANERTLYPGPLSGLHGISTPHLHIEIVDDEKVKAKTKATPTAKPVAEKEDDQ